MPEAVNASGQTVFLGSPKKLIPSPCEFEAGFGVGCGRGSASRSESLPDIKSVRLKLATQQAVDIRAAAINQIGSGKKPAVEVKMLLYIHRRIASKLWLRGLSPLPTVGGVTQSRRTAGTVPDPWPLDVCCVSLCAGRFQPQHNVVASISFSIIPI